MQRWKILRANWRDWFLISLIGAGSLAAVVFLSGISQLVFAGLAGAVLAIAMVGWLIGGDVYSLPWLWGSIGEELTAETLEALDQAWTCEHDLLYERGNFDHVVVGPPGVFLLDTKRLNGRVIARADALRAGRTHYSGAAFRAAAATWGSGSSVSAGTGRGFRR